MSGATESILEFFKQINSIPRCSRKEQRISDWLRAWGESHGYKSEQDEAMNVVIRIPGSAGLESAPTVILQGHMDMVCEKTPESAHDFDKDPICPELDGDWLVTHDTTLGADNGIAVALALAIVSDNSVSHPPLELLFTVDEETGLNGAKRLAKDWLLGRILINLDSEDEGVFTVGCAGGRTTILSMAAQFEAAPAGHISARITAGGLQGGHSGGEIHHNHANANQLIVRAIKSAVLNLDARIVSVNGGSADNAIARDAVAVIAIPENSQDALVSLTAELESTVRAEYHATEPDLVLTSTTDGSCGREADGSAPLRVLSRDVADRLTDFLLVLPHGVSRMSDEHPDLVETSSNFATVKTSETAMTVTTSQRSSSASQLEAIAAKVEAAARLSGATVEVKSQYPGWKPKNDSSIVKHAQHVYLQQFGVDAKIDVVHGGLECGVIGTIFPDMEMISIGPTIRHPHSPQERLNVVSLEKTWQMLGALLGSFSG